MAKTQVDRSILEAALIGFDHKLGGINLKIAEIKRMLGYDHPSTEPLAPTQRKRKPMSAAARARIAAAQRKRWAALKKQKGQTATSAKQSAPTKRRISSAARKRIAEASRKRWADYRAKKAQTKTSAATG